MDKKRERKRGGGGGHYGCSNDEVRKETRIYIGDKKR